MAKETPPVMSIPMSEAIFAPDWTQSEVWCSNCGARLVWDRPTKLKDAPLPDCPDCGQPTLTRAGVPS